MTLLPDFSSATFGDPTNITNMFFPLPGGTINSYGATLVDPETGEEENGAQRSLRHLRHEGDRGCGDRRR